MKLTFIIPCYNALPNLQSLIASLHVQKDPCWRAVFIDDVSTDATSRYLSELSDDRFSVVTNVTKKFALRNIIETSRTLDGGIVAVIDGDDELCNEHTVSIVKGAHASPRTVAWTAHRWDINGMNISKEMPASVNPYQHPWCSSHLRTFDSALLDDVPDANFKDHMGRWFERGYDQALMLPLLHVASHRIYVPDVCYTYKINSVSIPNRDWTEKKQLQTVNMVRARGFLGGR